MKRKVALFLSSTLVLFSVMYFLTLFVYAADRSYNIHDYDVLVEISSDGAANITETITYAFDGEFNGILRNIDYLDTDGISDLTVQAVRSGSPVVFSRNTQNPLDGAGSTGTYNYAEENQLAMLRVYEHSINETKSFIFKYTLLNVVTSYADIATFNRKIIDSGWDVPMNNVNITIKLPPGAFKEDLKVFAHGPLTGESTIVDGQTLRFKVPSLNPYTFVETLAVFPNSLVPGSTNKSPEEALQDILKNEAALADEANKIRDEAAAQIEADRLAAEQYQKTMDIIYAIVIPVILLLMLFWFAMLIYLYVKFDKEFKHDFEGKYYRELPGNYSPAEMSVLISFGSVQTRDVMATLMDLVRRKHLVLEDEKIVTKGFFGQTKEEIDYFFSLSTNPPDDLLKKHENFLIAWFVDEIGDSSSFSLESIKDYSKNRKNALRFKSDFGRWSAFAVEEAKKNKFFDDSVKKGKIIGILSGIAYFILGFLITTLAYVPLALLLCIQGIIIFLFSLRLKRYTAFGNKQKAMWKAFKNFLKDFSNLEEAIVPSIIIWEHYLVYAISLGVAEEVIDQLPLVFTDADWNNNNLTYMRAFSVGNFMGFNNMFNDTIHTVDKAVAAANAAAIANSARSSGSGRGGGFSGGSSFGGGGRGGGGAF